MGLAKIGRILTILHELLTEIRWSPKPRLLWELAVFRIFGYDGQTPQRNTRRETAAARSKPSCCQAGKGAQARNSRCSSQRKSGCEEGDTENHTTLAAYTAAAEKEDVKTYALYFQANLVPSTVKCWSCALPLLSIMI